MSGFADTLALLRGFRDTKGIYPMPGGLASRSALTGVSSRTDALVLDLHLRAGFNLELLRVSLPALNMVSELRHISRIAVEFLVPGVGDISGDEFELAIFLSTLQNPWIPVPAKDISKLEKGVFHEVFFEPENLVPGSDPARLNMLRVAVKAGSDHTGKLLISKMEIFEKSRNGLVRLEFSNDHAIEGDLGKEFSSLCEKNGVGNAFADGDDGIFRIFSFSRLCGLSDFLVVGGERSGLLSELLASAGGRTLFLNTASEGHKIKGIIGNTCETGEGLSGPPFYVLSRLEGKTPPFQCVYLDCRGGFETDFVDSVYADALLKAHGYLLLGNSSSAASSAIRKYYESNRSDYIKIGDLTGDCTIFLKSTRFDSRSWDFFVDAF